MVRYYSTMAESFFDSLEEAVKAERELLTEKEEALQNLVATIKDIYQFAADIDLYKLNSKFFREGKKLTKDDYVIICGDFGGVWDKGEYDKYVQNWYNERPWTTLFVDG